MKSAAVCTYAYDISGSMHTCVWGQRQYAHLRARTKATTQAEDAVGNPWWKTTLMRGQFFWDSFFRNPSVHISMWINLDQGPASRLRLHGVYGGLKRGSTVFGFSTDCDQMVVRIFLSRVNFLCGFLFVVRSTLILQQLHVKDSGHSDKNAGGKLHLNRHTPLTQRSGSELSRHSVGTYLEMNSHATCQGTFDHSHLSSVSRCGRNMA